MLSFVILQWSSPSAKNSPKGIPTSMLPVPQPMPSPLPIITIPYHVAPLSIIPIPNHAKLISADLITSQLFQRRSEFSSTSNNVGRSFSTTPSPPRSSTKIQLVPYDTSTFALSESHDILIAPIQVPIS